MLKRLIIILLSFLFLPGCNMRSSDIPISTVTSDSQELLTPTTLPSVTQTTISTSTDIPVVMNYQCLEVADHPPSNYILRGTLVFNNVDNTDAYLWDNDTKNVHKFPRNEGDRLIGFDVSPDRKHIAFLRLSNTKDELIIATANGEPVWSQQVEYFLWEWFDNERLIGLIVPQNGSPSLFLQNLVSGERQELQTDFPDSRVFSKDWFPSWNYTKGGLPVYDPTLTRVIYPECNAECQERLIRGEYGWPIALWDIEKGQVIARIITMDIYGKTPYWTPDGNRFIIATKMGTTDLAPGANEFFSMTRDGELRQLTHFTDDYKEIDIPDSYSMSPDGKLLAFWIVTQPSRNEGMQLAVLNIETLEVINYCIQGDPNGPQPPIWSPNNTQLLVVSPDEQAEGTSRVVLVDLVQLYAAQIGEDEIPVGWMVSP